MRDEGLQQDLDIDLVVAHIDTRGVINGVSVYTPTHACILDSSQLRESAVSALPYDSGSHFRRSDSNGIIAGVTDVGVGLSGGSNVGPDAPVP